MALRHLKHRYLIKEQFLEEKWLITSDFFFESFKFLVSLMGISLVWIYSNIPNAWWKDHNSFFHFFLFRLGTLIVGGCPLDGNVDCFDKVLLGTKWFKLFLSKERVLLRLGLSWDFWSKVFQVVPVKRKVWVRLNCFKAMKSCFWINMPLDINREWKR